MRVLTVDDFEHSANNSPVNLKEIGKRVRVRRVEARLSQEEFAEKAGIGVGTLQALEDAPNRKRPRQTSPANLQKIAKALGCSMEELVRDDNALAPADPLLLGLNREDLLLARRYHDATTAARQCIRGVLDIGEDDERIRLLTRILTLSAARVKLLDGLAHKMVTVPEPHIVTAEVVPKRADL